MPLHRCMMKIISNRWLPPFIWLATIALALLYLASNLNVISDISQFMPRFKDGEHRLSLVMAELEHGQTGRILFMRLRSPSSENTAELSKLLRQRLLETKLFDTVDNGEFSIDIEDFKQLYKYRYLINSQLEAEDFSETSIRNQLHERITELRGGMGVLLKHTLPSDPINGFIGYLQAARFSDEPNKQYGVWFSSDSEWALLIATISQEGFNIDKQEEAIGFIQNAFDELRGAGDAYLEISGPGSFAVKARHSIQKTLKVLSVVASILIVALLFIAYRSLTLVVLAGLPIISAILFSMAMANMIYGYVHGITLAFGITLLGICIDYPVHLFSHLREDWAVDFSLNQIMPTMLLGFATTGLGYMVLMFSGFQGLEQLAIFAVTGLASALAVTRWVLPSLLKNTMASENLRFLRCDSFVGHAGSRYTLLALLAFAAVLMVWNAFIDGNIWQKDISSLSPVPTKDRLLDREIRRDLKAAEVNHVFIQVNDDVQQILQNTERLASELQALVDEGLVDQVLAPTNLLPSEKHQRDNQQMLPSREELESIVRRAVDGTPFKQEIFGQFIEDVVQQRQLETLTPEDIYKTPVGRLIGSDLFQRSGTWISIIRLSGVKDEGELVAWLHNHPELARDYLNLRQHTSELLGSYADNVVHWLITGLFVMFVVLLIRMRSIASAIRVMLAPVLAILISIGLNIWFCGEVNLFHLMSVLMIIGLGIDYSLFINRRSSDAADKYNSCHGVLISACSTLLAFGVLILSDVAVLMAIGQTVAIGVIASLLLALVLADPKKATSASDTT